ncbi:MAG TPA: OB-fold domain-containing protein [Dehalococcoidia bacterium]|jgi:hypothetical protein
MTARTPVSQYYLPEALGLPAPSPDGVDAGFWEAAARHELVIQRCTDCRALRHPPQFMCAACLSMDFDWKPVAGLGTIYSFMNVNHAAHPALAERVPFNIVSVDLDGAPGIRMVGNLVDADYKDIQIGMAVRVHWEDHPEAGITIPRWQRA